MSYTKNNWQDLPSTNTPVIANSLNNMETGIADANGAIAVNTYSSSSTYAVGDYCIYNNKLYKCTTAISTAEAFNSTKWQQIKIAEEINNTGVSVSAAEPTGNNKNKVWLQHSKNKFNKDKITPLYLIDVDGQLVSNGYFIVTDFIEVEGNESYSYQGLTNVGSAPYSAYYDSNKNFISSFKQQIGENTIITPSNARYVRFSINKENTDRDTFQIEEGPIATDFENYVEDKIYVKNDNNVYEKFIMSENKVYSTEEVRIGTWISGKPLYRKVIQTTTPTCSTNGTSAWQQVVIQNVKFGMIKECQMVSNTTNGTLTVPIIRNTLAAGLNQFISVSFVNNTSNNTGVFQIENSSTTFNNRTVYAVIEYTKVTD